MTVGPPSQSLVKRAFWKSPYVVRMTALYAQHVAIVRPRVKRRIAGTGIPLLGRHQLQQVKRSDTLFVLGSGSSINLIPASRWETIRRHDSIGLNFWLFHEFVPPMYYFELVEGHEHAIIKMFTEISTKVSSRYRNTLKIASEFHNGLRLLEGVNEEFRQNMYAHLSVPVFVETDAQLTTSMRFLKRLGFFRPEGAPHNLFKHAGSLSTVLALAVKMGYRRIVLCGVDLNSPQYFYQDARLYPGVGGFQSSIQTAKHESIVPGLYRLALPVDKIVASLKKEILDPLGIEIFVENPSSALYPEIIPVAPDALWA